MRLTLILWLWLCVGLSTASPAQAVEPLAVGMRLPDTPMQGLNGPRRSLRSYVGRPLLINVWASWCTPCRAEMASLERLTWLQREAFTVIGISTDDYEHRAQAFLKASNATISHFLDQQLQLETLLGASRLPLTVLVSAEGTVLRRVYGAREWDSPQAIALLTAAFAATAAADQSSPAPDQRPQRAGNPDRSNR